jgi:cytochrome c biogenesis protein CcdA
MLHGAGGSAAAGVLVVGATAGRGDAVLALTLYAAGTAVSMALVSTLFGYALVRGASARRVESWIPALSVAGLVFGVYYTVAALR